VRAARRYFAEGWSVKLLAERYRVSKRPMEMAISGRTYAHVTTDPNEPAPPAPPLPLPRARRLPKNAPGGSAPCPPPSP
jgi:hypothetical protein